MRSDPAGPGLPPLPDGAPCRQLSGEDQLYREAFGKLLEAWMMLLQEGDSFPADLYQLSATRVFETYLQVHLAAPDGARTQVGRLAMRR